MIILTVYVVRRWERFLALCRVPGCPDVNRPPNQRCREAGPQPRLTVVALRSSLWRRISGLAADYRGAQQRHQQGVLSSARHQIALVHESESDDK